MSNHSTSKVRLRDDFLQLLDLKQNSTGATVEEIAKFLEVGANFIYQIRSEKWKKNPSAKLLRRLQGFHREKMPQSLEMNDAGALSAKYPEKPESPPHQFIRVELKSGNVFNLPIPPGPDGYERAVAAAAALDRASRGEQAATVRAVEALQATGAQVPVPPAADSP